MWEGRPFYTMQYVNGTSLEKLFNSPAPPVKERVALARQLLETVAYLHRQSVVHRDIKPANLIVSSEGELFLSDFGVVRWANFSREYTDGLATGTGEVLSTWNYLPPEIELETQRHYDKMSDVWAAGKTLLELLSWRPANRLGILLNGFDPKNLPRVLRSQVRAMLSNDPDGRPAVYDVVKRLSDYERKLTELSGLTAENYQAVKDAICTLPSFSKEVDCDEAMDNASRRVADPWKFHRDCWCIVCGSPYSIYLTSFDVGEEYADETQTYYGCLGWPGRPCGEVWENVLEHQDSFECSRFRFEGRVFNISKTRDEPYFSFGGIGDLHPGDFLTTATDGTVRRVAGRRGRQYVY